MKIIVITGHSKGIGKKLSEHFLRKGHIVYGISRSKSNIKNITQFECDIADHLKIKKIFKKIKKFDVLINNSSITKYSGNSYDKYIKIINTNLIGTYSRCLAKKNYIKRGTIINIASINAYMGFPNNPGYVSSKGGIKSLTQALALDYSKFNIRVNSISPGYINEGMSKASFLNKKKKSRET